MSDFTPTIYLQQVALRSLGFDPGPTDGIDGPKTGRAYDAWLASRDASVPRGNLALQSQRWNAASILPAKASAVAIVAGRVLKSRARYEAVSSKNEVPWFVIAGIHIMESDGDFACHLHEGSPLTGRTRYVPKGRLVAGSPPFTWEASALDALQYDRMREVDWKSLPAALFACERYNGMGYLQYHPDVPTPYLWAATTVERPGKYVSDGSWSPTAKSAQIGIAALWKHLEAVGQIVLPA